MNLEARKIKFVQEFLKLQSEEVVSRLEKILNSEYRISREEDFKQMTVEEFNSRIDQSMEDSKNGRITEESKLKAKIDKWG